MVLTILIINNNNNNHVDHNLFLTKIYIVKLYIYTYIINFVFIYHKFFMIYEMHITYIITYN